jgi:hypothetical protein
MSHDNIGTYDTGRRQTKPNTKCSTIQKTKKMSNMDPRPPKKNQGVNPRRVSSFCFLLDTRLVTHISASPVKVLSVIEGKKSKGEVIAYHLRNGYFITVNQCVMTIEIVQQYLKPSRNVTLFE